ncbi:MAG: ATP-binding cassette domain-containing protein [Inhella sp.]
MNLVAASAPPLAWAGLALSYPGGPSLTFPDLVLGEGEHLLLRGPSGAGKSSLIALLAGLQRPSVGDVVLAGQSLAGLRPSERDAWRGAVLGVLPQRLHLCEGLSLLDNLRLPGVAVGQPVSRERVLSLAQRWGLEGMLARRPEHLSGGQLQRAALARALVRRPRLLLLDEPSSSLDDSATETLLDLVTALAGEEGASLVVATHDARVVMGLQARCGSACRALALEAHA